MKHGDIDHTGITGVGGSVATDAIWDAAGDLAVGTGANTAAKLVKGADSTVLTIDPTTHVPVWAAPAAGGIVPWYIPPLHGITHVAYVTIAANWAIYSPLVVPAACTLTGVKVMVGVASGNISVALYDAGGSRVATSGAVACPSAGTAQTVSFTGNYSAAAGRYYLGVSMDNGTVSWSIVGTAGPTSTSRVKYQTSAHPCPSTIAASGETNYGITAYLLVNGGFPA